MVGIELHVVAAEHLGSQGSRGSNGSRGSHGSDCSDSSDGRPAGSIEGCLRGRPCARVAARVASAARALRRRAHRSAPGRSMRCHGEEPSALGKLTTAGVRSEASANGMPRPNCGWQAVSTWRHRCAECRAWGVLHRRCPHSSRIDTPLGGRGVRGRGCGSKARGRYACSSV